MDYKALVARYDCKQEFWVVYHRTNHRVCVCGKDLILI